MLSKCMPRCLVITVLLLSLAACGTSLPTNYPKSVSHHFTDTGDTRLGSFEAEARAGRPGESGFILLGDGIDAFVARAALARAAEKSIDLQYYLFHNDLIGRLLVYELLQAADRGVRVRLLLDDMDLKDRDSAIKTLDSHPNIAVRVFNPFCRESGRLLQFVTREGSVTRRMHCKSFTADNQASILGGRNIGNEYFKADPDLSFRDLDVLAFGGVAEEVSQAFDLYWNSELSYPIGVLVKKPPTAEEKAETAAAFDAYIRAQADSPYVTALKSSDLARSIREGDPILFWGKAQVLYDLPEKLTEDLRDDSSHMLPQVKPYFDEVKKEIIIFSPYFVPGKKGSAYLADLAKKGVRVCILTNSLASNDVGIVHAGYAKYRKRLLRAGVRLYEMNKQPGEKKEEKEEKSHFTGSSKASLHAKSFVLDEEKVFIGSMNLDPRSTLHNTEIGVVADCPEMAREMREAFDENVESVAFRLELVKGPDGSERIRWHGIEDGKKVVYDREPHVGFWRLLGISLLGVLPIESQL